MKKFIMALVCLMTMVAFSSCGSNSKNLNDKFNLITDNITTNTNEWAMVEKALDNLENYFYLHGKYDLEYISYLKTKIQISTDSLVVGEIYTRGKNSFDGGTAQHNVFIYYKTNSDTYFGFLDTDEIVQLLMRANVESSASSKNYIFVRYVKKHGDLNNETSYDYLNRTTKSKEDIKDIKFYKKYFDEKLGIDK